MGRYGFQCHDCEDYFVREGTMKNIPVLDQCPSCNSKEIYRDYSGIQVNVFKPYVDEHTTGVPTELTSFRERDAFHEQHGVTLDTGRYVRKQRRKSFSERIDKQAIIEQVRAGKAPKLDPGLDVDSSTVLVT